MEYLFSYPRAILGEVTKVPNYRGFSIIEFRINEVLLYTIVLVLWWVPLDDRQMYLTCYADLIDFMFEEVFESVQGLLERASPRFTKQIWSFRAECKTYDQSNKVSLSMIHSLFQFIFKYLEHSDRENRNIFLYILM